ncbi:MAG: SUMF1/EgtB/PvdO family nonheme iron enzyme, partial [Oscillospiraceae bacterium]|nr:SUMF1/EgtB/PvdO family nonheme iron enzyme [Oscillospiraceae bacterium]
EDRQSTTGTGWNVGQGNRPKSSVTWYDAQLFCARLYTLTGKKYRLATEAEWEFAAKGGRNGDHTLRYAGSNSRGAVATTSVTDVKTLAPNSLGIYDMSGNIEEWTWNSWSGTHSGGTNPTGPAGSLHTQKARRGGAGSDDDIYTQLASRRIRSIDGADGSLGFRIALSEDMNTVPAGMIEPRNIRPPANDDTQVANSYRDPRWVTGDSEVWSGGSFTSSNLKLWDSGEYSFSPPAFGGFTPQPTTGQWYTVNNLVLILVPNSGARVTIPYIFMDNSTLSVISDAGTGMNSPFGRLEKIAETRTGTAVAKPNISNMQTPQQLANAATQDHALYNMDNIPQDACGKDQRLLEGANHGWWLDGSKMGGTHRYRKDIDNDEFRFVVYNTTAQGVSTTILANGDWFTVNDVFLRVTHPNGYTADYLYAITADGQTMYHVSFQAYERGDFRSFDRTPNANVENHTNEIAKGQAQSIYGSSFVSNGYSTFRLSENPPPPCPGGCGQNIYDCTCPVFGIPQDGSTTTTATATTSDATSVSTTSPVSTSATSVSVTSATSDGTSVPTSSQSSQTATATTSVTTTSPATTTSPSSNSVTSVTSGSSSTSVSTTSATSSTSVSATTAISVSSSSQSTTLTSGTSVTSAISTSSATSPSATSVTSDSLDETSQTTTSTSVDLKVPGDVDLNGTVTIADALEILKYLAGMSSRIDDGEDSLNNSLILQSSIIANKPAIGDVLEILKKLAKMNNAIDNPPL